MKRIITIAAQKGGVGKTTTAASIAQALRSKRKKVLLLDLDGQRNLTKYYDVEGMHPNIYEVILNKYNVLDAIQETELGAIVPGSANTANLDLELNKRPDRDYLLKEALEPIKDKYDYVVIDTAPGMSTGLIQALTTATDVIIPTTSNADGLDGTREVLETINQVKKYCNNDLNILGVVITQYMNRATLTKQYAELIENECHTVGIKCAKTKINHGIAIQEARAMKEDLFTYAPNSKAASNYLALVKELKI